MEARGCENIEEDIMKGYSWRRTLCIWTRSSIIVAMLGHCPSWIAHSDSPLSWLHCFLTLSWCSDSSDSIRASQLLTKYIKCYVKMPKLLCFGLSHVFSEHISIVSISCYLWIVYIKWGHRIYYFNLIINIYIKSERIKQKFLFGFPAF